jgi:sterol desaturase/sphingolipid hydroxylase (fatty acid hydroxylase superfamily)
MFESRFIDQFSRTHWAVVPFLFGPGMLVSAYLGVGHGGASGPRPLAALATALLGVLTWTFIEYWLHRELFHWEPPGAFGKRMHFILHGVHHKWPRDQYRLVMPTAVSISLFFLFLLLWKGLFAHHAYAFHAGFTAGYMFYDLSHYYIHHASPRYEWLKKLRKHHLVHHSPKLEHEKKFGVSTTLWDHAFGTYAED